MNKLLGLLALASVATACQHQAPLTQRAAATSTDTAPTDAHLPTLLRKHNLASTLALQNRRRFPFSLYNGFFGREGYHIELVLLSVQRDSLHPGLYQVRGKSRYKNDIMPLVGTIAFTQVLAQPRYSQRELEELEEIYSPEQPDSAYTATGSYELRQVSDDGKAGIFRGKIALDFALEGGAVQVRSLTKKTPTQGGGIKYDGTWTNPATGQLTSVVWVGNIISYQGPQAFDDFLLGGRSLQVNPKYAKLGWNNYWKNDEWWADAPEAKLSL